MRLSEMAEMSATPEVRAVSAGESILVDLSDLAIPARVEGRKVLLLDSNVWIDLADARTEQAIRLRERLLELGRASKLFCPLAFSTIAELFKQEYASALRVGRLMEDLSLNTAFLSTEEIFEREVDSTFAMIHQGTDPWLDPCSLFVPVVAYLCSRGTLIFPKKAPTEILKRMPGVVENLRTVGFVELLEGCKENFSEKREQSPDYSAATLRRKAFARGIKERARRVEEEAVVRRFVTPRFLTLRRWLPLDEQVKICKRMSNLPLDRYQGATAFLLKCMPAIRHHIDVMTAAGLDYKRNFQMRDFFDLELIIGPLVYSDALVTRDKWIKHILASELGAGAVSKKHYLWTYDSFEEYLENL